MPGVHQALRASVPALGRFAGKLWSQEQTQGWPSALLLLGAVPVMITAALHIVPALWYLLLVPAVLLVLAALLQLKLQFSNQAPHWHAFLQHLGQQLQLLLRGLYPISTFYAHPKCGTAAPLPADADASPSTQGLAPAGDMHSCSQVTEQSSPAQMSADNATAVCSRDIPRGDDGQHRQWPQCAGLSPCLVLPSQHQLQFTGSNPCTHHEGFTLSLPAVGDSASPSLLATPSPPSRPSADASCTSVGEAGPASRLSKAASAGLDGSLDSTIAAVLPMMLGTFGDPTFCSNSISKDSLDARAATWLHSPPHKHACGASPTLTAPGHASISNHSLSTLTATTLDSVNLLWSHMLGPPNTPPIVPSSPLQNIPITSSYAAVAATNAAGSAEQQPCKLATSDSPSLRPSTPDPHPASDSADSLTSATSPIRGELQGSSARGQQQQRHNKHPRRATPCPTAVGPERGVQAVLELVQKAAGRGAGHRRGSLYKPRLRRETVHVKMPWLEPEDLSPNYLSDVQERLTVLGTGLLVVGACVRRGCVQLALDVVLQAPEQGQEPPPGAAGPPTPAQPTTAAGGGQRQGGQGQGPAQQPTAAAGAGAGVSRPASMGQEAIATVVTAVIESTAGKPEHQPGEQRQRPQQQVVLPGAPPLVRPSLDPARQGGEADASPLVPGTPAADASRSPTAGHSLGVLQQQITGNTGDLSRRVSGLHGSLRPSANNSVNLPWTTGPRSRLVAALTAAADSASMAMSTARSGVFSRNYQGPRSGATRDSAGGHSLAHALAQGTEGFPLEPPPPGYYQGEDDSGRHGSSSSKQLQKLPPHDWVHHLYLQPPRDAEVLVQACGRAFVTSWDVAAKQWTTRELPPGYSPDGSPLPPDLPRVLAVVPTCLALSSSGAGPSAPSSAVVAASALGQLTRAASSTLAAAPPTSTDGRPSPGGASVLSQPASPRMRTIVLHGPNVGSPRARFVARLHGKQLRVEVLGPPPLAPAGAGARRPSHTGRAPFVRMLSGGLSRSPTAEAAAVALSSGNAVQLGLHGIDQPGLLLLECWCGKLLTSRKQVVIVSDEAVVGELGTLEGTPSELGLQPTLSLGLPRTSSAGPSPKRGQGGLGRAASRGDLAANLKDELASLPVAGNSGRLVGSLVVASHADAEEEEGEQGEEYDMEMEMMGMGGAESGDRKVDDLLTDLGCWVEFVGAMQYCNVRLECLDPDILDSIGIKGAGTPRSAAAGTLLGLPAPTSASKEGADAAAPEAGKDAGAEGGEGASKGATSDASKKQKPAAGAASVAEGAIVPTSPAATTQTPAAAAVAALGPPAHRPSPSAQLMHAVRQPGYQAQMLEVGVQLLEHACSCAWRGTASMLLRDLMALGCTYAFIKSTAGGSGMTLLHRAVCSGSQAMVQLVVGWGYEFGDPWNWSEADPQTGITPLHVAAIMPSRTPGPAMHRSHQRAGLLHLDNARAAHKPGISGSATDAGKAGEGAGGEGGGTLADWILQEYEAAWQFWHGAADATGSTPADIAEAAAWQATASAYLVQSSDQEQEGFLAALAAGTHTPLPLPAPQALQVLHLQQQQQLQQQPTGGLVTSPPASPLLKGTSRDVADAPVQSPVQAAAAAMAAAAAAGGAGATPAFSPMAGIIMADDPALKSFVLGTMGVPDLAALATARGSLIAGSEAAPESGTGYAQSVFSEATVTLIPQPGAPPPVVPTGTPPAGEAQPKQGPQQQQQVEGGDKKVPQVGLPTAAVSPPGVPPLVQPPPGAGPAAQRMAALQQVQQQGQGQLFSLAAALAAAQAGDASATPLLLAGRTAPTSPPLLPPVAHHPQQVVGEAPHLPGTPAARQAAAAAAAAQQEAGRVPAFEAVPAKEAARAAQEQAVEGNELRKRKGPAAKQQATGQAPSATAVAAGGARSSTDSPQQVEQRAAGAMSRSAQQSRAAGRAAVTTPPISPSFLATLPPVPQDPAILALLQPLPRKWSLLPFLLRSSAMMFPSRRVETRYVQWLAHQNTVIKLLVLLMTPVFVAVIELREVLEGGSIIDSLGFCLYVIPGLTVLTLRLVLGRARAPHTWLMREQMWILHVLWMLMIHSLQAANIIYTPRSVVPFLRARMDAMSVGAVQALFQIRPPNIALLRCLYILAATALYIRLGAPGGPSRAFFVSATWNIACFLAGWLLDITSRYVYVSQCLALRFQGPPDAPPKPRSSASSTPSHQHHQQPGGSRVDPGQRRTRASHATGGTSRLATGTSQAGPSSGQPGGAAAGPVAGGGAGGGGTPGAQQGTPANPYPVPLVNPAAAAAAAPYSMLGVAGAQMQLQQQGMAAAAAAAGGRRPPARNPSSLRNPPGGLPTIPDAHPLDAGALFLQQFQQHQIYPASAQGALHQQGDPARGAQAASNAVNNRGGGAGPSSGVLNSQNYITEDLEQPLDENTSPLEQLQLTLSGSHGPGSNGGGRNRGAGSGAAAAARDHAAGQSRAPPAASSAPALPPAAAFSHLHAAAGAAQPSNMPMGPAAGYTNPLMALNAAAAGSGVSAGMPAAAQAALLQAAAAAGGYGAPAPGYGGMPGYNPMQMPGAGGYNPYGAPAPAGPGGVAGIQQQLMNQFYPGALQQQQQQQHAAQMPLAGQGAGGVQGYMTAYLPNGQAIMIPTNQVMQVPGAGMPPAQMPRPPFNAAAAAAGARVAAPAAMGGFGQAPMTGGLNPAQAAALAALLGGAHAQAAAQQGMGHQYPHQ